MENNLFIAHPHQLPTQCLELRVLIVDDDELLRELLAVLLRGMGLRHIEFAADGGEALLKSANTIAPIDLLICDLAMGGMDGVECFRKLAAQEFKGGVIVLSASDARVLSAVRKLVEGHGLYLLDVLSKPFDAAALRDALVRMAAKPANSWRTDSQREPGMPPSIDALRAGLAAGAVEVYFQPKISATNGEQVSAECLLRWRDPAGNVLSPSLVIPAAEDHGLIGTLTRCVFTQAMQTMARWADIGLHVPVSVNISMDDLADLELPSALHGIAAAAGADLSSVTLEVTESRLMRDPAASLEVISRLCLLGCRISIDDFGTGHATLESLRRLPFSELKLDRHVVSDAVGDPTARAILQSSVSLAHQLEMSVVAEGIETRAEWDIAVGSGCDQLQGYAIGRPMPAAAFREWYRRWMDGPGWASPPAYPAACPTVPPDTSTESASPGGLLFATRTAPRREVHEL